MTNPAYQHGGALDAAIARLGGPRADWLDLSTGINPVAPKLPDIPLDAWARLPEASDHAALLNAARAFYGAGGAVVAAPGTQVLISLWPFLFAPMRAAILGPTYAEHAIALANAGHAVIECKRLADIPDTARLVTVVNPNNPDGRMIARSDLLALAKDLAARDGLLVVDEAFMDADPSASLAADATDDLPVLVLKSFGKYFGLAGLRLGFALCGEALARRLATRLGPWAVSGPALSVATALLDQERQSSAIRHDLLRQSALTRAAVQGAGPTIAGGTSLFTLIHHADARHVFETLAKQRILTRPFAYAPHWLRIGNVADAEQAERLAKALLRC